MINVMVSIENIQFSVFIGKYFIATNVVLKKNEAVTAIIHYW